ncbi:Lipase [Macleaya cordata]|uniref:Lipase n=1 Tax=Macleaya cordata TaxID=56857 RepID=A0A200Q5T9_MACCD|nr:Lipase [Macleaya cordata]
MNSYMARSVIRKALLNGQISGNRYICSSATVIRSSSSSSESIFRERNPTYMFFSISRSWSSSSAASAASVETALAEKAKKEKSDSDGVVVSSYWGVSRPKVTREDGTVWPWNCFMNFYRRTPEYARLQNSTRVQQFPRIYCNLQRGRAEAAVGSSSSTTSPEVPAMFVFGDSLVDDGNNNHLTSFAKSNYVPYGIDFYQGPTGRFCNGKTIVDFLGELLGLPYLPAYTNVDRPDRILGGVNYASAAAGILDQTGQDLGERFSLNEQISNFESNMKQLKNEMGEKMNMSQYLAKSIVMIIIGSNDYINNYLLPTLYPTSYYYKPDDYADLLISHYNNKLVELHNAGLRKFLLAGVGPLGCIPNQLATGLAPPGQCVFQVNEIVKMFNVRLRSLVDRLNANYPGAIFVYGDTYGAFGDIIKNPTNYAFKVNNQGCCGLGKNQGQVTCLPLETPCTNRKEYVFWDAFHPTEAVNAILAQRAYSGPPSDCHPINVKQMAQI